MECHVEPFAILSLFNFFNFFIEPFCNIEPFPILLPEF